MFHLTKLATALALLAHQVLAQDMQAVVPSTSDSTVHPIQVEDPSEQTSYISPNSPTAIPPSTASSSASGQVVVCTAMGAQGGPEICSTFTAMTSFSSLTMSGTGGILTASDTRSTHVLTRTATVGETSTTGTVTRTRVVGESTAAATESGEGSAAGRQLALGWKQVLVAGGLGVLGGLLVV